jgi:hypothetical protein
LLGRQRKRIALTRNVRVRRSNSPARVIKGNAHIQLCREQTIFARAGLAIPRGWTRHNGFPEMRHQEKFARAPLTCARKDSQAAGAAAKEWGRVR